LSVLIEQEKADQVMMALMLEDGQASFTRYHLGCQYHITICKDRTRTASGQLIEIGTISINWAASIYLGGQQWQSLRGGPCISIVEADAQAKSAIGGACGNLREVET
jgi:hypothetical protein